MKYVGFLLIALLPIAIFAQSELTELETYPVFPECQQIPFPDEETCFKNSMRNFIVVNFRTPEKIKEEQYEGEMVVLFEVTAEGIFKILYVDAVYSELKGEMNRVFSLLPVVQAPTFNGRPTFAQFRMPVKIPLDLQVSPVVLTPGAEKEEAPGNRVLGEYDAITSRPLEGNELVSSLNIPLSHERYSRFDAPMNRIGTNTHTASKPYMYREVAPYYDFEQERRDLQKEASTWLGRKLWNEHLVTFQGENYWFTGDVVLDLQLGRDFQSDFDLTYNNTRGAIF